MDPVDHTIDSGDGGGHPVAKTSRHVTGEVDDLNTMHLVSAMDQDALHISVSSPKIAIEIRPLPSHAAATSQGIRKKTWSTRKTGEHSLSEVSNVLQVKPIPMKPREDGPMEKIEPKKGECCA